LSDDDTVLRRMVLALVVTPVVPVLRKAALGLDTVAGLALDAHGNLVITDGDDSVIWVLANSTGTFYGQSMTVGDICIVAGNGNADYTGDGGPARAAPWTNPRGPPSTHPATSSSPMTVTTSSAWWPRRRGSSTARR
jgi:hypothetical protein